MKGHIAHAEAAAGGFGEGSLAMAALNLASVGPNVHLRVLNAHVVSFLAEVFSMPLSLTPKGTSAVITLGHINSFGLTGIIAHAILSGQVPRAREAEGLDLERSLL